MEIIIHGLRISTDCSYVKFTQAEFLNIYEKGEGSESTLHIDYPLGFLSSDLIDSRIEILNPVELKDTEYIPVKNPTYNICGLEITKTVNNPYIFSQFLVEDVDNFIMNYTDTHCEVIIPKIKSFNTKQYICLLEKNPYLKVVDCKNLDTLYNVYSYRMTDKQTAYSTKNNFIFKTKHHYIRYIITGINYINSFINVVRNVLKDNGYELVRIPIDQNIKDVNRVTYQVTDMDHQVSRKSDFNPIRFITQNTAHIEFKLSTPNLEMYFDFRNRFQNLDFLSNLTQFYTTDKLGKGWIANAMWSPIDTSFNQDYPIDSQSNTAFEAGFSADLMYQIMYDESYHIIQQEILSIIAGDRDNLVTL